MATDIEVAYRMAEKAAVAGANLAAGLVSDKPGKLLKLIFAYAPEATAQWVVNGRLRLARIKANEATFNQLCFAMLEHHKKVLKKYAAATGEKAFSFSTTLEQLESDLRLLATVQRSFAYISDDSTAAERQKQEQNQSNERDQSWWDMFEDFARRINEDWRIDLLAKALAAQETHPDSMRRKALWEIAMLEADDFGALSVFCNSSVYLDGKPLVLLDPEEQNKFKLDASDDRWETNLAHVVSALTDKGLVQKILTQFDTTEVVTVEHLAGTHYLKHTPPGARTGDESAIQVPAYGPTDYALDICRLYQPCFNIASDANYAFFKRLLETTAAEDTDMGSIEFSGD
ncbi:hypothetical protein [Uliginosibacterium sp. TH139]|uniref:hypothetical protein n=1 Tax=Uliginosibacterium sp. TH139 TaxID=2067453 RepID=UPI000C7E0ADA|nr:hypothetical protein [Uliginosibacterium sp. TH139]PLK46975.1 hypothetical protein C0V76_19145 [Uliginosibacterium sp. TH139]